ncbi:MAG: dihydrodipicolinate synthase family protein [Planctomycetales bacterium]|nr:dihydrodipicolinate synthase family protein [Planctomycetales bacterium]
MKHEMDQPIRGIIPPMVTPLAAPDQLDEPALRRLVDHLIAGGVHGLFLLGTTGEGPSLSSALQRQVIAATARHVDRRVPILVGVTSASLADSLALAQFAADAGCEAIVAAPPYYFPIDQTALRDYYLELARSAALPTVLYNMPAVTSLTIDPETLEQLIDESAIVALKDSSGDMDYFQRARQATSRRVDFPLLIGPEHLLAESLARGGNGGVAGGANVFPEFFTEVYDAHLCGDQNRLAAAQRRVERLQAIYAVGPVSIPGVIARTKAALAARGLCQAVTAPPIAPATSAERQRVTAIIEELAGESARTTASR